MSLEVSDEVASLSQYIDEVENRSRLFYGDRFNDTGYRELQGAITEAQREILPVEPETKFDNLILADMSNYLEITRHFADFLREDSGLEVSDAFDMVYGEDAFRALELDARQYDEKTAYKQGELGASRVIDKSHNYQELLEPAVHQLVDRMEEYGKKNGLIQDNLEFETQVIPSFQNGRAHWDPRISQMNVSTEGFDVIRENGLEIDATKLIHAVSHELWGHAYHQNQSENIPYPQFADSIYHRLPGMAQAEGVSQLREEEAAQFIEDEFDTLAVSEEGLELRNMRVQNKSPREVYTSLLKHMNMRGEIEEDELMGRVSDVYKDELVPSAIRSNKLDILTAFKEGSYSAGNLLMEKAEAETKSIESLTTGLWTPQLFPQVAEFLEKESRSN